MSGRKEGAQGPAEVIRTILTWWKSVPYPALREFFLEADGWDDGVRRLTAAGYESPERWISSEIEVGQAEIAGFAILPPQKGRDAWITWFRDFTEPWKEMRLDVQRYEELDSERVLVDVVLSAEGAASGAEVTLPIFLLWTVRDGQAQAYRPYAERAQALGEVGQAGEARGSQA